MPDNDLRVELQLSSHEVDTILDYGGELMEEIKKIRKTQEVGDAM